MTKLEGFGGGTLRILAAVRTLPPGRVYVLSGNKKKNKPEQEAPPSTQWWALTRGS